MRLPFHTLDVFTETRFAGNPLAVVLNAAGLDDEAMQSIAREFNLSETVFVLPADDLANSAKLRIFTPVRELPFAGHPTVGTAALLARLQSQGKGGEQTLRLEEKVGLIPAVVSLGEGEAIKAEFGAPKLPEPAGTAGSAELIV